MVPLSLAAGCRSSGPASAPASPPAPSEPLLLVPVRRASHGGLRARHRSHGWRGRRRRDWGLSAPREGAPRSRIPLRASTQAQTQSHAQHARGTGAMSSLDAGAVTEANSSYPKPPDFQPSYGTAGFRARATVLASTLFRCGLFAAARALQLGAHVGLMITASHNPQDDNGVKLVEPDGGMLPQSLEPLAAELAQAESDEQLLAVLRDRVVPASAKTTTPSGEPVSVLLGHDTRPSAGELLSAAIAGVRALGVMAHTVGCVTTPQLHLLTFAANHPASDLLGGHTVSAIPPPISLYYAVILGAFEQLMPAPEDVSAGGLAQTLYVDCANGVAAERLRQLESVLRHRGTRLVLRSTGEGRLNHRCGADFVQKERVPPDGFTDVPAGAR
jgi:phosphoacetylglucosamine mutase